MLQAALFENAHVRIYRSNEALGQAAADHAASLIQSAIANFGRARIMVATGNSQLTLATALALHDEIDWRHVEVFHMDEYAGISSNHPSSFRYWIRTRIEEKVHPGRMEYIEGDASDLTAEAARYSALLAEAPIHLAFVGFGENGHIAFNDPGVADFEDPLAVKLVALDDASRRQQAGEGHFPDFDSVPREALTVTCSSLFRADAWVCAVPERRKAEAVCRALTGPITPACPASIVRRHPNATVYLDPESSSLLGS